MIELKQWFGRLLQRWAPLLVVRHHDSTISTELLMLDGYEPVTIDQLPEPTPFSQTVALIDDQYCSFRVCHFPCDMVERTDLDEAIELDVSEWSPFSENHILSFVGRDGDQWSAAVWVWTKSVEYELLASMPNGLECTHVLPESAWYVAQVKETVPTFLVCNFTVQPRYFLLSSDALPLASMITNDVSVSKRFWKSLGSVRENIQHVLTVKTTDCWVPESFEVDELEVLRPRSSLLSRARLQGVKDWADPVSWRKPLLAVASLFIVWIAMDAAVLQYQTGQLHKQLTEMKGSVSVVLNQRNDVERMNARLQSVQTLRQKQGEALSLLAELSQSIPADIWLDIVQFKSSWLDIRGQGKDVARLLVLLEQLEAVEKVILLNDIRPDARTGIEKVQLRLILKNSGRETGDV